MTSAFEEFDFDGHDKWRSYLTRLEPEPTGRVLEKRKRRWFKANIDVNFDDSMPAEEKPHQPATSHVYEEEYHASQPSGGDTSNFYKAVEANMLVKISLMLASVFLLLSAIPFLNRISIPLFVVRPVSMQVLVILFLLVGHGTTAWAVIQKKGGYKSLMSLEGFSNIMTEISVQYVMMSLFCVATKLWVSLVPPYIALFQIYAKTSEFRAIFNEVGKMALSQNAEILSRNGQADQMFNEIVYTKLDSLRVQSEVIAVFVTLFLAILSPMAHLTALFMQMSIFRIRYMMDTLLRRETSVVNTKIRSKLPAAIDSYYGPMCDKLYAFAMKGQDGQ